MQTYTRKDGELYLEELSLNSIAEIYGTPCYVYSRRAITEAYRSYIDAMGDFPGKICYAVKANSNLAVLQILASLNSGFDIVSSGELRRVLMAGGKAENVIFSGVGKTRAEMRYALENKISCFNVESEAELLVLNDVAKELGVRAPISLRVNPDVDAQTHPYISTGLRQNKFGIDIEIADETYAQAKKLDNLEIVGVDCHIGSQLTDTRPFLDALDRLLLLVDELAEDDITIRHLDLGGGLGVNYRLENPPTSDSYLSAIKEKLGGRSLELVLEPGRSIVAQAGVLLTEVIYLKHTAEKHFAIIDAAMNDNIRPALYHAWQDMQPLKLREGRAHVWDLVGPVCETADFLAKDRELVLDTGDRLALMTSGAYGFVMSSNYNSRTRAAEVLVDGDKHYLVRERESFDDLIRGENLLPQEEL